MRIAIDCRKYADYGIGTYIRGLVSALAPLDGDEQYLLIAPPESAQELPHDERFEIIPDESPKYSIREMFGIARLLDRLRPDVFHAPHYVVPFGRRPTVVTIHDLIHLRLRGARNIHRRAYATVMLRRGTACDAIITVSHAVGDDVVRHFASAAGKIHVIHNGVDAKFKTVENRPVTPRFLLYVGNDKPHKNLEALFSAFLALRRDEKGVSLVLAGATPERFAGVEGVVLAGRVSDEELLALYRDATALILPSLDEGFGLPVLEAMACGTPVICSHIPALAEVTADAALLVDPRDTDGLRDAMRRMLDDESLREKSSIRGRARASEFSWERTARETLEVYRRVAATAGAR